MAHLNVRVIPRSPKSAIGGTRGDAVLVRLAAPPVDGAANDALIEFLSKTLQCPRRAISIVSGQKSRDKRVSIEGLSEADLSARLSAILNAGR
jgi:uncharacterized protein (TIGR00251 family)